jgi:benzodiazapine receptor
MLSYGLVLVPTLLSSLFQFIFPSNFDDNKKVFFQPPGYVFAINWTIIYLLLGVYLYRVVSAKESNPYFLFMITVYILNISLNMAWTPMVNTYKNYKGGIFTIGLMIFTTFLLISIDSNNVNRTLLVPYLSWLLVALLLNVELARMNYIS